MGCSSNAAWGVLFLHARSQLPFECCQTAYCTQALNMVIAGDSVRLWPFLSVSIFSSAFRSVSFSYRQQMGNRILKRYFSITSRKGSWAAVLWKVSTGSTFFPPSAQIPLISPSICFPCGFLRMPTKEHLRWFHDSKPFKRRNVCSYWMKGCFSTSMFPEFRAAPGEVTVIRKMAPVNMIVYYPQTEKGKEELARRVAEVHADAAVRRLKSLNCPTRQKLELLDAVMDTARKNQKQETNRIR